MTSEPLDQLKGELERLVQEYPGHKEWRELLDQVRNDTAIQDERTYPRTEPIPPPNEPCTGSPCWVCGITPSTGTAGMCHECAGMYRSISAGAIADLCSCRHTATGSKVYVYRKGGTEELLCGRECVRAHFNKIFGLFRGVAGSRSS